MPRRCRFHRHQDDAYDAYAGVSAEKSVNRAEVILAWGIPDRAPRVKGYAPISPEHPRVPALEKEKAAASSARP